MSDSISSDKLYQIISNSKHPVMGLPQLLSNIDSDVDSEVIFNALEELESSDEIERMQVGMNTYVWYTENDEFKESINTTTTVQKTSSTQSSTNGENAPNKNNSDTDEIVILFPERREIVAHTPTQKTKKVLGQISHLVDSSGDGYLYRISREDVWNTPHETFESYISDLRSILPEKSPYLEERLKSDWEDANQFILRTNSKGHVILEAKSEESYKDVAKRKLEHNKHYTRLFNDECSMRITKGAEADVKGVLYDEGYPVTDLRELEGGTELDIDLVNGIELRDYQQQWVDKFIDRGAGTFVGAPGSGKTVAALGAISSVGDETLIIVPNIELVKQWVRELKEKTTIKNYKIGEYHGQAKNIKPITVATYDTAGMTRHRKLFNERDWGLVVYDEAQHIPSKVWKRTANIQSRCRLGLTATPVRESGNSKQIYTLIGPPVGTDWGLLFDKGYVSKPTVEIKHVEWDSEKYRNKYNRATGHDKRQIAAKNPAKIEKIRSLINEYKDKKKIIFVEWIDQGKEYEKQLDIPFIYGKTSHKERERKYNQMRNGELDTIILSRIGDEGVDLPDAEVCIIASTLGGSRAQTAQRIGRTMRPVGASKGYIVATKGSNEEDFVRKSTRYLTEQGIRVKED